MADDYDQNVDFLYKTMLHRDPKKRQVKLVERHLLQLDFAGLDDSSDDSDFEIPEDKDLGEGTPDNDEENDDDESYDDADDRSSSKTGAHSDSEDDSDADSGDEVSSERGKPEIRVLSSDEGNSRDISVGELIEQARASSSVVPKLSKETKVISAFPKKLKVVICCVCLGENSEEDDEIVECDGCGVSVHEGCYGISESQSVASTESSASTEPWFCDACKAGIIPRCELCPNLGGIFKETDAGKWVHVVCALYVPGVAFGDIDKLSPVTLFEMSYSKWGAKPCCLCEDDRFSHTGVCIACDAGMCRSYFHVTCAQREGLLSEASPDQDIADPFYAYCKQHADKNLSKGKRRNWLAIQSSVKKRRNGNTDEKEKARVDRKLDRHREKYIISKQERSPHWMPTEKMPRMLTSSPSAMKRLMKKAELLGVNTQVQGTSQKDIRKKWHIATALSVDFVSYYLDRNVRIQNMKSHQKDLITQKEKLKEQEKLIRLRYDQLSEDVSKLRHSNQHMRRAGEKLWRALIAISPKKLTIPEMIQPRTSQETLSKMDEKNARSPPALIHQCGLCKQTHDQHMLVQCDACKLHYHMGCLDPPLTRMPKKSKLYSWQCSECVSSSSDESEASIKVDPDAPRRLRETIKEPAKFTPFLQEKYLKAERRKVSQSKSKKKISYPKKRPATEMTPDGEEGTSREPTIKKAKAHSKRSRPPRPPKDVRTDCCCCSQPGTNSTLVRCDGCRLCYHLTCLDPPAAKTPKQRGYDWYCAACQGSGDSDVIIIKEEEGSEDWSVDSGRFVKTEPSKVESEADTSRNTSTPREVSPALSSDFCQPVKVKHEVNEENHEKTAGKEAGTTVVNSLGMMSDSEPKPVNPASSATEMSNGKSAKISSESKSSFELLNSGNTKQKTAPKTGKRITDIAAMLASKKSPKTSPPKMSPAFAKSLSGSAQERKSPVRNQTETSEKLSPLKRKSLLAADRSMSGTLKRTPPKQESSNSLPDLTLTN